MKQNVSHVNGRITINVDVSVKKYSVCEKDYVWNPSACNFENRKYLASVMDDSVITRDKVMGSYNEKIKTVSTNFSDKNMTCKAQHFYILHVF